MAMNISYRHDKTQEAQKKQDMKNINYKPKSYKAKEPLKDDTNFWGNYTGATCCEVCKETCHYPCVDSDPSHCEVLHCTTCKKNCRKLFHNDLYCTVCTGKCPVSKHVRDKRCTECEDECNDKSHKKTPWRYVNKIKQSC